MAANDNVDTFVFYPTFLTSIEAIKNAAMRLAMFEAVVNYGVYGTLPDFTDIDPNGLIDGMFLQMRFSIDEAKAKRSTNRENGIRGGAPKGNKNACKNNRKQPNSTENNPNVNVNDNVNVNMLYPLTRIRQKAFHALLHPRSLRYKSIAKRKAVMWMQNPFTTIIRQMDGCRARISR